MHQRGKRTRVVGWSQSAARRHRAFLWSVDRFSLDGYGYAPTLTLRDCPPSSAAFHTLRTRWIKRLVYMGATRVHWVIEWQRRGVPHMHTAVYFDRELSVLEQHKLTAAWVDVASEHGTTQGAQHCAPIDGPLGWLQYLSKHSARGVAHYQRQGKPAGWETTGRLWGHTGEWPLVEPDTFTFPREAHFRLRRLARSMRIADARLEKDPVVRARRIRSARRMLACNDRKLSEVRGVAEWLPQDAQIRFLDLMADQGMLVRQF